MLKVFETDHDTINFVDDRNVVLGIETDDKCCEKFEWFFTLTPPDETVTPADQFSSIPDNNNWVFNTDFFFETNYDDPEYDEDEGRSTKAVVFQLVDSNNKADCLYLHIHNNHNGYYTHNLDMKRTEGWNGLPPEVFHVDEV